ncbi:fimbrillin family protein [Alistipes finegoldii]|uniref:fimbrillin family protein n=1 Tax=Alistipes finegoldii TaxID=214856 RepID=UPI0026DD6886|nr:fimbrillin family protein [Alistipes finegoldii]
MKETFTEFPLRNFLRTLLPTAALLAAACTKDPTAEFAPQGRALRFDVAQNDGWNTPQSRAEAGDETPVATQVIKLQGETPADTLFLHVTIADGIEPQAVSGNDEPKTRADLIEDISQYGAFEVLGFAYTGAWESSLPANLMNRVKVVEQGNGIWAPASTTYHWPGANKKVRFFAIAPEKIPNIYTDKILVNNSYHFDKDILFADSGEMAGDTDAPVPLTFKHIMSCLKFVTGDDMKVGKISSIVINNVQTKHKFSFDTGVWEPYTDDLTSYGIFSSPTNEGIEVDGTPDVELCHYFLPSQRLSETATLRLTFRDAWTSKVRYLTASVGGMELPMGKTVTFRLSTSSITVEPHLQIGWMNDFSSTGGTHKYTVASYIEVTGSNGVPTRVATPWTAEFSTDDGQTWTTQKPEWLTEFTSEGAGGYAPANYTATAAIQQRVTSNRHNDILQAATPVVGTYDLSTNGGTTPMNTANCYIVNAPGTYSLPLVYGNAVKNGHTNVSAYTSTESGDHVLSPFINHLGHAIADPYIYNNEGCTPQDARLVWQDEKDLVTDIALSSDRKNLIFEVGASTIRQGNAVVAVRDAAGTIMWSWHIWVTDFVPGLPAEVMYSYNPDETQRDRVVTNLQGNKYTFMGVNIGWCDPGISTSDTRSAVVRFTQVQTGKTVDVILKQTAHNETTASGNCPYFQFGRKDPMLPSTGTANENKIWYDASGTPSTALTTAVWSTGNTCITSGILNPAVFCINQYMDQRYYNLWSANNTVGTANDNAVVKTIYDPSPVGYHMPASNACTSFTYDGDRYYGSYFGSWFNSPYTSTTDFTDNYFGWEFYCNKMTGKGVYDTSDGMIYYPASGHRFPSTGKATCINDHGDYWLAGPNSGYYGYYLYFNPSLVDPHYQLNRSYGFAVRPVREQ